MPNLTVPPPLPGIQRRLFQCSELRVAAAADGKARSINGHAIVYDVMSVDLGGFIEVVRPGAVSKSLRSADVRCLFNHDTNLILGRTKPRTLRLTDEAKGLAIECDLPTTTYAADLATSIDRGDVDQMSFAFRTVMDRWTFYHDDRPALRELLEIEIFDVSPVTFPAYEQTDVGVRSLFEAARARHLSTGAMSIRSAELALLEAEE